ncbi:MAG: transcriptional regulator, IclR family [Subtercola sp.]|nr:transcriptional regulator, IclR family [Subtercola sp.]
MKEAPAVGRAVELLNYMTVNPLSEFTQSELANALDISPASMSSILLSLTNSGYLTRHPTHKTFELGPALVALGYAASLRHPVVELARPDMAALAAFGTECIGSAVVGDEIVNLAIEGQVRARTRELRIGQRIPLVPPYGHVFLAWSTPAVVSRWIDRIESDNDSPSRSALEHSLHLVRERGFALALDNEHVSAVQKLVDQSARQPRDADVHERLSRLISANADDYMLSEVDPAERYLINNVAAPIFGPQKTVIYALTIHGIGLVSGAECLNIAQHLADVCLTLTRRLGGHAPPLNA